MGCYILSDSQIPYFMPQELAELCAKLHEFQPFNGPKYNQLPILILPYRYTCTAIKMFMLSLYVKKEERGLVILGPITYKIYREILSLKMLLVSDELVEVRDR